MKITDVRTAEIKGHGYSTYVRVYTDEGLIGNGECIHGGEGCPERFRRERADMRLRESSKDLGGQVVVSTGLDGRQSLA